MISCKSGSTVSHSICQCQFLFEDWFGTDFVHVLLVMQSCHTVFSSIRTTSAIIQMLNPQFLWTISLIFTYCSVTAVQANPVVQLQHLLNIHQIVCVIQALTHVTSTYTSCNSFKYSAGNFFNSTRNLKLLHCFNLFWQSICTCVSFCLDYEWNQTMLILTASRIFKVIHSTNAFHCYDYMTYRMSVLLFNSHTLYVKSNLGYWYSARDKVTNYDCFVDGFII